MRLADYAKNHFSQFGEDGMLEQVFKLVGEQSRFCVEFGAADGVSCSNTKRFRDAGWSALLIEADVAVHETLKAEARTGVRCLRGTVTPTNIDLLLEGRSVDFMSIDVDGDDYAIFEAMQTAPRVVCIEYNASIPPHVALHQAHLGTGFGASALALCTLARGKGYELAGLTKGNLIFVRAEDAAVLGDYERELEVLYDKAWLTYLVTDYAGRAVLVGNEPPWGLRSYPCVSRTIGDATMLPTHRVDALRDAYEVQYGPSIFLARGLEYSVGVLEPDDHRRRLLRVALGVGAPLVLIDVSDHDRAATFGWIEAEAQANAYQYQLIAASLIAMIQGKER